ANIKRLPSGRVMLLDFGLAKIRDVDEVPGSSRRGLETSAGLILGTCAYMSPEQARGGPVDKRADVWAFGVVLYEMLAGKRLFDEGTVSDTLAGVLKSELTLDALPRSTPPALKRLIARCLTRDWRQRLRDIGEARIAIEGALAHPEDVTLDADASRRPASQPSWQRVLPWAIAAAALLVAGVSVWAPWRAVPPSEQVTRLSVDLGADLTLPANAGSGVALSPDGRLFALAGSPRPGDRPRLHVRRLDELQASPLPGTDGASSPFFSPDGLWIGFFADGKLKKIPVRGGTAVTLSDAPDNRGGSWSEDGWIAFSPRSGEVPLFRVSSDGGTPEPLTQLGAGEVTHRWPQVLPGGRAVLYTASKATGNYEEATIVVRSLPSGETRTVHQGGYYARYLPTGHLVYISQGTLFAAPFNLERLAIESQPSPLLTDVTNSPITGGAQFTFAENGSFAYVPAANNTANPSIFWMSPDGKTQPLRAVPAVYNWIRFSPGGDRLATTILNQQSDVWVYEWGRDILSRLTSHPSLDANPVWTPDGQRITFRSARDGVGNLYWQRADGTGEAERLTQSKIPQWPMSWHPSGKFLAFQEIGRDTGQDVWIVPMDGDEASGWKPGKPTVLLAGRSDETEALFSADGRWLAYQSDESGRNEVHVVPFPGPGSRSQVSTSGGSLPRWSGTQSELFYLSDDQKITVAAYTTQGDSFRADKPRV
ncbi:MAG TPA: protein kinase, partial [Rhodothermia bacterium]|nr:protein kinase [Rhodothermia bacterium]